MNREAFVYLNKVDLVKHCSLT